MPPKMLTHAGETLPLREWATRAGLPAYTVHARLAAGWPLDRALRRPSQGSKGRSALHQAKTGVPDLRHDRERDVAYSEWREAGATRRVCHGRWGSDEAERAYRAFVTKWADEYCPSARAAT